MNLSRCVLCLLLGATLFSCKFNWSKSKLDIANGYGDGSTKIPFTVGYRKRLKSKETHNTCTATVVSPDTILTAAHCVVNPPNPTTTPETIDATEQVEVKLHFGVGKNKGKISKQVLIPKSYSKNSNWHDIAFVVFDSNTFEDFVFVAPQTSVPKQGDKGFFVGIADDPSDNPPVDAKKDPNDNSVPKIDEHRWGRATVTSLSASGTPEHGSINVSLTPNSKTNSATTITGGDSGGTFINEKGELIGIISRSSTFTNLHDKEIRQLMKQAVTLGATICGLEGADESKCKKGKWVKDSVKSPTDDHFPFKRSGTVATDKDHKLALDVKKESTDSFDLVLYVSGVNSANSMSFCVYPIPLEADKNKQLSCESSNPSFKKLKKSSVTGAQGRYIFESDLISAFEANKTIVAVEQDPSGSNVATTKFDVTSI